MKKTFYIIIIIFLAIGCNTQIKKVCDCNDLIESEGVWAKANSSPYTGQCETHYKNGNLESSSEFMNGKMQGHTRFYYESGKLKEDLMYQNNMNTGQVIYYYESGHKELEGYSKNGKQFGKMERIQ